MSPRRSIREVRGATLAILASVAVITGGAIGIWQGGVIGGGGGQPPPGTANVWIDPNNGSDTATSGTGGQNCIRYSTAQGFPGGTVCATIVKAYQLANKGDHVLIRSGTFTANQFITKTMQKPVGGSCNWLGSQAECITFEPEAGATVNFQVGQGVKLGALGGCTSYMYLKNVTFLLTTYTDPEGTLSNITLSTAASDNTCRPTNTTAAPPHDLIFENLVFYGPVVLSAAPYNTCIVNSIAAGAYNIPWNVAGGIGWRDNPPILTPADPGPEDAPGLAPHDNCFINNVFQGYNFINDGLPSHHMECVHVAPGGGPPAASFSPYNGARFGESGANNFIWRNNLFLDCPVEGLFPEIENGATMNNNIIEGNVFTGTQFPLKFSCHSAGCTMNNNIIRFNTSYGAINWADCNGGCNVSGNEFYGNLGMGCPAPEFTTGWTSSYNVFSIGSCATPDTGSIFGATISYVSPNSPNYNYALANCTQVAANYVSPGSVGGYPSTDYVGVSRPQGTNLDAGAVESCPPGGTSPPPPPSPPPSPPPTPPPSPPPTPPPPVGFGTGGSTATCATNPCSTGTTATITVPTTDGAGKAVSWKSQIYVPGNISGPAPLMIDFGGPINTANPADWTGSANANRYIWMKFWCKPGCSSYAGYPDLGFPDNSCGASGTAQCDDTVALKDTIDYVEANYNIDDTKLFAAGDSKGGSMTKEAMCSTRTNGLFRGYAPASSAWGSTAENVPVTCAARSNGNRDFSIYYLYGSTDTFGLYTGLNKICGTSGDPITEPGCQGGNGWKWAPVAGLTQVRTDFGCTANNVVTTFGTTGKLVRTTYDSCPVIDRAVANLKVTGVGHAFNALDGADGLDVADEIYTWLAAH